MKTKEIKMHLDFSLMELITIKEILESKSKTEKINRCLLKVESLITQMNGDREYKIGSIFTINRDKQKIKVILCQVGYLECQLITIPDGNRFSDEKIPCSNGKVKWSDLHRIHSDAISISYVGRYDGPRN
jgi:hypothetical protein